MFTSTGRDCVGKPIAINKSSMFSHISDVQPSTCVEDTTIPKIIKNGFTPLEERYKMWENEAFIKHFEDIILKK